jgi:hypothetical protein
MKEWRKLSLRAVRRWESGSAPPSLRRAFLSSTFRDLAAERAAVRQALQRLGSVDCVAMEGRGANTTPPREACLTAVEGADLIILLLGDNYGSIDAVSGLSMTRMEYEHARKCGIPVLGYVKRQKTDGNRVREVASPDAEIDGRVRDFIAALDGVTFSSFSWPEDLAIQVVCDVARFAQPV